MEASGTCRVNIRACSLFTFRYAVVCPIGRRGAFILLCSRMKRFVVFSMILAAAAGLSSCNRGDGGEHSAVVSVSIMPLQYFVDRLTDGALEVNVMVPPGASHATYSPTPGQFRRLSDSDVYFRIGHLGYEKVFLGRLSELNPSMKVIDLSAGMDLIRGEEIDHGDHVHEGGIDPHIWMSPAVMLDRLPLIRDAIVEAYPGVSGIVDKRYPQLYADVEELHFAMEELTRDLGQRSFMIFHPALTYLARDYGLEQVPIERGGKEPSPGMLRDVIREARARGIGVIFIQQEFDVRSAQLVSEETGAAIVQINPLAYEWTEGMEHIMEVFKTHLR